MALPPRTSQHPDENTQHPNSISTLHLEKKACTSAPNGPNFSQISFNIVVSSIHSLCQLAVCICAKDLKSNQKTCMQVFAKDAIEGALAVAVT